MDITFGFYPNIARSNRAGGARLGTVAQLVERRIEDPGVGGSIPSGATRLSL